MKSIKELVRDHQANFKFYRDGQLWYQIDDFMFPVPLEDVGNATFNNVEKGMMMMRYIRKQMNFLEKANEAQKSGASL